METIVSKLTRKDISELLDDTEAVTEIRHLMTNGDTKIYHKINGKLRVDRDRGWITHLCLDISPRRYYYILVTN